MIPFLHPEFIAVLLGKDPAAVADSQTDSNSNVEQPAAKTGGNRGPSHWKVSWSRFFRLFEFAAILAVLWLL